MPLTEIASRAVGGAHAPHRQLPVRAARSRWSASASSTLFSAADQSIGARDQPGRCRWLRAGAHVDRRQRPAADALARRGPALRRRRAAAGRRRAVRHRGQRLAPMAEPRHRAHPAVRAHEDRVAAHARVVLPEVRGPHPLAGLRDRGDSHRGAGVPDQAPARPRHVAADRGVRLLRAVPRGALVEGDRRPRGRGRRGGAARCGRHMHGYQRDRILSLHRPVPRSAGRGLPLHAGVDRDRLRRRHRQGLAERHADAPRLPARAPHRLHLRRVRRGVRPDRQRHPAAALHAADRPRAW